MQHPLYKIFLAAILNPVSDFKCDFFRTGALVMKRMPNASDYKVVEIGDEDNILPKYVTKRSIEVVELIGQLIMPAFFDAHFHWVQDDVRLMAKDSLLKWLQKYTWPHEERFKDKSYSLRKAKLFAKELLSVGTLGGGCYASIHGHTVDHALKYFVGDFKVGNVLMTMNSPEYLIQSEKNAINLVKEKSKKFGHCYALTPRFAPTTAPSVMKTCANNIKRCGSFTQSHLCETKNEIDYVISLYRKIDGFKDINSYTEIYQRCSILGKKTVMGHGIYLNAKELQLLKKSKTAIAHCPTSNAPVKEKGLGSGLFDFRKIEASGIRWAMGSDIGGGPFLSMFDVMRSFVSQNRAKKIREATYVKALYRSTLAGAEIFGMHKSHGNFAKGKFANFIVVDVPNKKREESAESILKAITEQFSRKRNEYVKVVKMTFYKGNLVFKK